MSKVKTIDEAINENTYTLDAGITQSILSCWSCRRKFLLCANGWHKPDSQDAKFAFGNCGHECLEHLYNTKFNGSVTDIIDSYFIDDQINKELMTILIDAYIEYYSGDMNNEWFNTEEEFDVMYNKYRLRGKIDGVLKVDNKLWLMEHKFFSRIQEDVLLNSLTFNSQILFYALAAEIIYGQKIEGVIYNIVRKPQYKSIQNFTKALDTDTHHFFPRFVITINDKVMMDYKTMLNEKLSEIDAVLDRFLYPYINEEFCVGKYTCEYLDACASRNLIGFVQNDNIFPELTTNNGR